MNMTNVCDATLCSLAEITDTSGKHVITIFGKEGISGQKYFPPLRQKQQVSSPLS
jgi:hypothetical protein